MFCTRARSCARADDAKSWAVGMRNAKPGNHLKVSPYSFWTAHELIRKSRDGASFESLR